jgi:hypothetical protein
MSSQPISGVYWPGGDIGESQAQSAFRHHKGAQPAASYKPQPQSLSSVVDTREFKTEAGDHYRRFDGHPTVVRAKAPQARYIESGPFQGRSVTKEDFNGKHFTHPTSHYINTDTLTILTITL